MRKHIKIPYEKFLSCFQLILINFSWVVYKNCLRYMHKQFSYVVFDIEKCLYINAYFNYLPKCKFKIVKLIFHLQSPKLKFLGRFARGAIKFFKYFHHGIRMRVVTFLFFFTVTNSYNFIIQY